ncbi:hypothetical protein OH492_16935 [Vibrio chagasii]|nr:hypothetical protein [Vibrio chagasii]
MNKPIMVLTQKLMCQFTPKGEKQCLVLWLYYPKSEFYANYKLKAEGILTATREEAGCLRFRLYENKAKRSYLG